MKFNTQDQVSLSFISVSIVQYQLSNETGAQFVDHLVFGLMISISNFPIAPILVNEF